VSFEQEQILARLRRRPSSLWLGHLVLAIVSAGLTWCSLRPLASWLNYTIDVVAGLLLLFFWLIPAWRFATNFVDITNARLIVHGGMFGRIKRDVQSTAITGVEFARSAGITINLGQGEPLILKGFSRPKALAETLRQVLGQSTSHSLAK
jgi:hypothetical protein